MVGRSRRQGKVARPCQPAIATFFSGDRGSVASAIGPRCIWRLRLNVDQAGEISVQVSNELTKGTTKV